MRYLVILAAALGFAITLSHDAEAQGGRPGVHGIPDIRLSSPAVGRTAAFRLRDGAPGADWVAFVDTSGGPTVLPFGTLSLGATPSYLVGSFDGTAPRLDATGAADAPVTLPAALGFFEGVPLHFQALVADPTAAFGVSISESLVRALRRPRVFVGSSVPGNAFLSGIESSSGAPDFDLTLSQGVTRVVSAPQERCLAAVLKEPGPQDDDRLVIVSDETGDILYSRTADQFGDVVVANDGRTLLVVAWVNTSYVLRTIDLATLAEVDHPTTNWPAFVIPHPDLDVAFLVSRIGELEPIDYRTGTLMPPIATGLLPSGSPTGSVSGWAIDGTELHLATRGDASANDFYSPGVATVDLSTSTLSNVSFFSPTDAPVTGIVTATSVNGPSVFVRAAGGLKELDPATHVVRRTIAETGHTVLSSSGGEIYFLDDATLRVLDLATDTVTALYTVTDVMSEPVAVPGRIYFVDDRKLVAVDADPYGASAVVTTLAGGANLPDRILYQVVGD